MARSRTAVHTRFHSFGNYNVKTCSFIAKQATIVRHAQTKTCTPVQQDTG
jgi:hypothetical protein